LGKDLDWEEVISFIDAFALRRSVTGNLRHLKSRRILIPGASNVLRE
jgi:hypothetical protein